MRLNEMLEEKIVQEGEMLRYKARGSCSRIPCRYSCRMICEKHMAIAFHKQGCRQYVASRKPRTVLLETANKLVSMSLEIIHSEYFSLSL